MCVCVCVCECESPPGLLLRSFSISPVPRVDSQPVTRVLGAPSPPRQLPAVSGRSLPSSSLQEASPPPGATLRGTEGSAPGSPSRAPGSPVHSVARFPAPPTARGQGCRACTQCLQTLARQQPLGGRPPLPACRVESPPSTSMGALLPSSCGLSREQLRLPLQTGNNEKKWRGCA